MLFDGSSLEGWNVIGDANWELAGGAGHWVQLERGGQRSACGLSEDCCLVVWHS